MFFTYDNENYSLLLKLSFFEVFLFSIVQSSLVWKVFVSFSSFG